MNQEQQDKLETEFVDAFGLDEVLATLSDICYAKQDHIATNWQDTELAKQWSHFGGRLDTLASLAKVRLP